MKEFTRLGKMVLVVCKNEAIAGTFCSKCIRSENEPDWDLVAYEREPDWQMMRGTVPEKEREPNRAQRNDMAYKKSIDRLIDEPVVLDKDFEPELIKPLRKKPPKRGTAYDQQLAKWETKHGKS